MKSILYFSLISLLIISCEKGGEFTNQIDNPTSSNTSHYENIHPEMRSYFVEFEKEANRRGLNFEAELNLLNTSFADIPQSGVAGQCRWHSSQPNLVTIDTPFWNNANESLREWVMFHELGHCILDRDHSEAENQNGICLSIMASGTGSCQSEYNANNKEFYLDELFSEAH